MPYTPKPTGRKANDYLADAMQDLKQARNAIYEVLKKDESEKASRAEELAHVRRAIYDVFKTTDPVKINRAMADALDRLDGVASLVAPGKNIDVADALELLDGVAYSHQEMLLLHNEASKRGEYKKMRSNGAKEPSHE